MRFPDPTAPDLAAWLSGEFRALTATTSTDPTRPLSRAQVLVDDAAVLREAHRRLQGRDVTPQAGATYISGWFAGELGRIVGLGLASAGAGLVLDGGTMIFDVVEEGWPERVRPGRVRAIVAPDHPWAGSADVEVVPAEEVLPRTMAALVEVAAPLIEACRGLAKVSVSGLWDEVADGVVSELAYCDKLDVTPLAEEIVTAAVAVPGMPWKARPKLVWAESDVLGRVLIAQKGGCCLAFTCRREPAPESELTGPQLAYRQRFGLDPVGKRYCGTCRFRDLDDVVERRVAWAELNRRQAS